MTNLSKGHPVTPSSEGDPSAGFTLLEMVITLSLLAVVVALANSGLTAVLETSADTAVKSAGQRQELAVLRRLRLELGPAKITGVTPGGLRLTYQRALDLTGTGSLIDASGEIVWGAMEEDGPVVGNTYTLDFVPEDVVRETDVEADLNHDGDLQDVFDLGHLESRTSQGRLCLLTPSLFLVDSGTPDGDLNGDGAPDPMFSWQQGQPLTVRFLNLVKQHRYDSRYTEVNVFLPNMQ